MKMFKRFAAALLAGVMVLAMLTACGGSGNGSPIAPGSDAEKAEAFYMDVYNALLNANYTNDPTLKTKAREILDDSLNEDGSLKSGKEMTVTLDSDNLFVQTAISIVPSQGSSSVPRGFTSEELALAIAHKDEALADVRNQVGSSMDIIKKCTTNVAVGAVKKGDKIYVAVAMTMDLTKVM